MRQIKYRFWNPQLNKMFYGEDHWDGDRFYTVTGLGEVHVANETTTDSVEEGVIPSVWIDFKDINGEELYQGDVCKDYRGNIDYIKWEHGRWKLWCEDCLECFILPGKVEKIGNIYENPELLT